MKAYPKYKPSGIDWLGEIPSHWLTLPMKYILAKSSAGVWGDEANEDGKDVVCFRVADFDYPHLKLGYSQITYRSIPANQLSGREVNFGDIVIEKSGGGDLNPVGRAVMSTFNGVATCSNFMHVISSNDKADNSYLNYLLATIYGKGLNWRFFAQTTGIQNLNIKAYLSQPIPLPTLTEQEAIAEYLDEVTGKIDALVAEKQALVDELRAYRTSLITESVTRGLNPNAPLKNSGIDWLGDIPEHWNTSKLKFYIDINSGVAINREEIVSNGKYPVYGGGERIGYTNNYNIDSGTIIIGRVGARCGCVKLVDEPAWATDNALICTTSLNPKYLSRLLEAANLNRLNESNAQPLITSTKVKNLILSLPPLSEQEAIADFLDAKTAKIDEAIAELEAQLKDLTDYKQAVITEAVTGKVDVRDWKTKN